jgi:hypothetical protein
MVFFRLTYSADEQVIGDYPQSQRENQPVGIMSPVHYSRAYNRKVGNEISLPQPILHSKAKITDFLSCVSISARLVASEKAMNILTKYSSNRLLQILSITVLAKNKSLPYWIFHPFNFYYQAVEFEASEIWRLGLGASLKEQEYFNNFDDFALRRQQLSPPESLMIKRPILRSGIDCHFFPLTPVTGGIGYYVSERVRTELINSNCTGMEFVET